MSPALRRLAGRLPLLAASVFVPGQIKQAERNTGSCDRSNPSILYSNKRPLIFYSGVERGVAEVPLKSGTGAQWVNAIKKRPNVKHEELDWMGLPDWLNEQKGQVTKDQVEQYVAAHTAAEFTHSICPSCVETLYPENAPPA